jgi:phosphatidylglycerophosphatase A
VTGTSAGAPAPRLRPADWRDPAVLLAVGFGSGFAPRAPGTFGSLAALAIWWWLIAPLGAALQLAVAVATLVAGTWLVARIARRYGIGDDPAIVVDEFAGLWIALLAVPRALPWALAGFALFRLFDIWKPWPVRTAERRAPGALGVMLDDVVAGLLACAVLHVTLRLVA